MTRPDRTTAGLGGEPTQPAPPGGAHAAPVHPGPAHAHAAHARHAAPDDPHTADAGAVEPSFSEQISDQLGGWRGLVESSIPITVFVVANLFWELRPAIIVAVAAGLLIALFRLARQQSVRHAVNGLFGIFLGALIAWRSGDARDFYLPGIIYTAGYAVALFASVGFRWPLVGWIWSILLDRGSTRWRDDPELLRAFGWLTVIWAVTYLVKAGVQYALYVADQAEWLGISRIVVGWPLYALLLAITVWRVRLVTHRQA